MDLTERERQHIARALRGHATGLRKLAAESDPREFDLLISALIADAAESERLAALMASRDHREHREAALRREQSARLWSALQAVVAVMAMDVLYTDFVNAVGDTAAERMALGRLRAAAKFAGWFAAQEVSP